MPFPVDSSYLYDHHPTAARIIDFISFGVFGVVVLSVVRKKWRIYQFSRYRKLLKRIQGKKSRPTIASRR